MINTVINNYRILSIIGRGGMGTVYLAEHTSLKRKAAIKALNPELTATPEIKNRFFNEAVTLSKLSHNNIVTLYDFTEQDGNLYLIMEYVSGKSLDEMIRENSLSINRGLKIFNEILNGFSYAHREGVVHRDIKPGNIIITGNDTPKILDFGIAKIMDSDITMTKTGTRMGSVLYMSPEQILGKNIDYRSDIYSLGVTLFQILSGMLPYSNALSEFEIQNKIVQEPLPYIRNLRPDIPESIQNAIITATAKNPDARFACCEDFQAALNSHSYVNAYSKTTISNLSNVSSVSNPHKKDTNSEPQINKKRNRNILIAGSVIIFALIAFIIVLIIKETDNLKTSDATITNENRNKINPQTKQTKDMITESEAIDFIHQWQQAQNDIDIPKYVSYYADEFFGIKRTLSGKQYNMDYTKWINDRRKMYSNASYINVACEDIKVTELNSQTGTAKVSFQQTYLSTNKAGKSYDDQGRKIIKLKKDTNGKIKIIYEELIYSTNIEYGD